MSTIRTFLTLTTMLIASTLVANGQPPKKQAKPTQTTIDDQRFDLVCESHSPQTGQRHNEEQIRIDLSNATWCRVDLNACNQPKHLIVLDDELWMNRGEVSPSFNGLTAVYNYYVNRKTGLIRFERNGTLSSEGMCRKLPYGSDVPNKF